MIKSFLIDEYHKKPYYAIDLDLRLRYLRCIEKDLGAPMFGKPNNWSNKTKKKFGFILVFRKIVKPTQQEFDWIIHEARIEIHNMQKLFIFRMKHGL